MKLLKIIFLIINIILFTSCDVEKNKNPDKPFEQYASSDLFEMNNKSFTYFVNRADFLLIESHGLLKSFSINRVIEVAPKKIKYCSYFKEIETPKDIVIQTQLINEYFLFYVDNVRMDPSFISSEYLRIDLPRNSLKVEIRLKPEYQGIRSLNITQRSNPDHCAKIRLRGAFDIEITKFRYGSYKNINLLRELTVSLKLTRGFIY